MAGEGEWKEARETAACRFHGVPLTGLETDAEYEVEVRGGGAEIGRLILRAGPKKPDAFTFFAYGDTRTNPRAHARIATAMLSEARRLNQYTFVLHTGDFARSGSDEERTAQQFFRPAAELLARISLVPVRGNHENPTDLYRRYFPPQLGVEAIDPDDRCIDYGSVRIIVMNKYAAREDFRARLEWVARKLAEASDKWRILSLHEPMYTSGKHGSATQTRAALEPVLVAGKAHAVIGGHDHNYERTRPIKGVTHFTAGGGGAPLRGASSRGRGEWSVRFEPRYHFLALTVSPQRLAIRAIGLDLATGESECFDAVDIPWDCGWPEEEPADLGS
jgi:predicted phosphodiesterase